MKYLLSSVLLQLLGSQDLIFLIFFMLFFGLSIIPLIFYLITLQNTLFLISESNRKIPPNQVWLILIPFFGLVWQFIVVNRIADSLKKEFNARNIVVNEERPGVGIGIAYCILFCCFFVPLAFIGGVVCWIIYWTKINDYRMKLLQN